MQTTDNVRFFKALNILAAVFSDEMTEIRQRTYWQLFCDKITIEEWEYACTQAMTREIFHKVPLPAQLLDYVREYRSAKRATDWQRDEMPDGSHTREQLLQLREALITPEEIRQLIQSALPGYGWEPPQEEATPNAAD